MGVEGHSSIAVVVLGDIGRSPRMQYHALALAEAGWRVDLVGYQEAQVPDSLTANPRIRCHALRDLAGADRRPPRPLFLLVAAIRLLHQSWTLFAALTSGIAPPRIILTQVPPALPTMLVAWLAARRRGALWFIDWHNYGYAMLGLRIGPRHPVTRLARRVEGLLARQADAHLCVSQAMRGQLADQWQVAATVLYDRPAARFRPLDTAARLALFKRLPELLPGYQPDAPARPALLVSSTSWTADEDFNLLLDAASEYDAQRSRDPQLAAIQLLITGRGPLQAHFEKLFQARRLQHVQLRTAWLADADYPSVLASADLGVSLHRSASGVDLPMKVADMLGCGLPVCMLDYAPCVREMVEPQRNGVLFTNAGELAARWVELLRGFPAANDQLTELQARVRATPLSSWSQTWADVAQPLFAGRQS